MIMLALPPLPLESAQRLVCMPRVGSPRSAAALVPRRPAAPIAQHANEVGGIGGRLERFPQSVCMSMPHIIHGAVAIVTCARTLPSPTHRCSRSCPSLSLSSLCEHRPLLRNTLLSVQQQLGALLSCGSCWALSRQRVRLGRSTVLMAMAFLITISDSSQNPLSRELLASSDSLFKMRAFGKPPAPPVPCAASSPQPLPLRAARFSAGRAARLHVAAGK